MYSLNLIIFEHTYMIIEFKGFIKKLTTKSKETYSFFVEIHSYHSVIINKKPLYKIP